MNIGIKINILFWATTIGVISSVLVHLCTFFDLNIILAKVQFLHFGAIIIWLLIIVIIVKSLDKKNSKDKYWQLFKTDFPKWVIFLGVIVLFYTVFNFLYTYSYLCEGNLSGQIGGKFFLPQNGEVIKNLSNSEYLKHESCFVRFFSGHWIFFYFFAWAVLFRIKCVIRDGDKKTD